MPDKEKVIHIPKRQTTAESELQLRNALEGKSYPPELPGLRSQVLAHMKNNPEVEKGFTAFSEGYGMATPMGKPEGFWQKLQQSLLQDEQLKKIKAQYQAQFE